MKRNLFIMISILVIGISSCKKEETTINNNSDVTFKQLDISLNSSTIPASGTNIDINKDGIADFVAKYSYTRVIFPSAEAPYTDYYNLSLKPLNGKFDVLTYDDLLYGDFPVSTVPYVNLYNENDAINDSKTTWMDGTVSTNTAYIAFYERSWSIANGFNGASYKNEGITTAFKYIGIRMIDTNGNFHYGWIKAKVTSNFNLQNLTIESAAIHNTEDTDIKAGQKE